MRKTFDIKNAKILEHLDKQPNQTKYVETLILKDIEKSQTIDKEAVIQIIKEYLNDTSVEKHRDKDVKNSINKILLMKY